jgi:hypothetical protein
MPATAGGRMLFYVKTMADRSRERERERREDSAVQRICKNENFISLNNELVII